MNILRYVFLALSGPLLLAQPVVQNAVNAASYANPALPNGSLAQGGMFIVQGSNLGPANIEIVNAFPLPTTLAGVSVRVTVGSTTVDCIMIYSLNSAVAAVLPSSTPTGAGTLRLTFNGQTSDPVAVRVVRSSFGIFALNQGGSGPGVFTDSAFVVNTLNQSAAPGSVWVIWGTGLGPVQGDEAGGPLPGDLTSIDVQVTVGGVNAAILYRGRSGCCTGIDQIAFTLPPGITGCYVPVVVTIGGVSSNYTTMSIAAQGTACSDPGGLTTQDVSGAGLTAGAVTLTRTNFRTPVAPGFADLQTVTDTASASFGSYTAAQLIAAQTITSISNTGVCTVYQFRGLTGGLPEPVVPTRLDAGAEISVVGPGGVRTLTRANNLYTAALGGSSLAIPGLPGGGGTPYLAPGSYTINNGSGAQTGAFTATVTLGAGITPTNLSTLATVPRGSPLILSWTGGAAAQTVVIEGYSAVPSANAGAAFLCRAPIAAGSFAVPAAVLAALPASGVDQGLPAGLLSISTVTDPVRFTATGLAFGQFTIVRTDSRRISYE